MLAKFKAALAVIASYLIANPGSASLVGSGIVLAAAKLGLHVSEGELAAIAMALLPLVVGGHVAARRAAIKRLMPVAPHQG